MSETRIIASMARIYAQLPDAESVRRELRALLGSDEELLSRMLTAGLDELAEDSPRAQLLAQQVLDRLLLSILTDTHNMTAERCDRLLAQIFQAPELTARLQQFRHDMDGWHHNGSFTITITGQDGWQAQADVGAEACVFPGVHPGEYELRLQGRVLWAEILEPEFLLLDQPLRMAAATEAAGPEPSMHWSLMNDEIRLSVWPGIESGTLCLERSTS
jgi:hypothetical protein